MTKKKRSYKRRSNTQLEQLAAARANAKRQKTSKRIRKEVFQMRRDQLRKMKCGRIVTLMMYVLLFLQILNMQSMENITQYEATTRIARYSNMSPDRLSTKLTHYMRTGNFLVKSIVFY